MFECFIVGTGTDVGKTFVAAGVASIAVDAGLATTVVKPVQTGTDGYEPDTAAIARMLPELEFPPHRLETILSFAYPASPHLAAEMEGKTIDPEQLLEHMTRLRCETAGKNDAALIVEGAGGVLVPLTRETVYLDIIRRMEIPALLVALAGLGTINHTLLTLEALENAGIKTAGVVLNMAADSLDDPVEQDNAKIIEHISNVPVLATISGNRGENIDSDSLRATFASETLLGKFVLGETL